MNIIEKLKQNIEARERATKQKRYVDRDFPESKISNSEIVGTYKKREDAEFDVLAANDWIKLNEALIKAVEGLQDDCGNRCAHQNPCAARKTLTAIEELLNEKT